MPKVSVIIPTRNRPDLIGRSVKDALSQTLTDIEVIVVIDGPDPMTVQALESFHDSRLSVIECAENRGAAVARNTGFLASKGEWIAFQDDDDEWMPENLERQVSAGEATGGEYVFTFCRYLERTGTYENVRPEVLPAPSDIGPRFVEYMYCHRGLIVPCDVVISRALAQKYPFDEAFQPFEDTDCFIRCMSDPEVKLAAVSEVLAIHNNYPPTGIVGQYRMSRAAKWQHVFAWAVQRRVLFTNLSFALLMTRHVTQLATNRGASFREKLSIFSTATLLGSFHPKVFFAFIASALFSKETKHRFRRIVSVKARRESRRITHTSL